MTITIAALIIGALTWVCYSLVQTAANVQTSVVAPFLYRMHMPNAMNILTEEEHDIIHRKVDTFNFRALFSLVGSIISVGLGLFFIVLVMQGGDAQLTGTLMAVAYAGVCANYSISSSIIKWIRAVENTLLARIIESKQEASEFDTLGEYLDHENKQMMADYYEEMNELADEFDKIAEECGLDPSKNYDESDASFREFIDIMSKANAIMREKYPEKADKFQETFEK